MYVWAFLCGGIQLSALLKWFGSCKGSKVLVRSLEKHIIISMFCSSYKLLQFFLRNPQEVNTVFLAFAPSSAVTGNFPHIAAEEKPRHAYYNVILLFPGPDYIHMCCWRIRLNIICKIMKSEAGTLWSQDSEMWKYDLNRTNVSESYCDLCWSKTILIQNLIE